MAGNARGVATRVWRQALAQLPYLVPTLGLIWSATGYRTVLWAVLLLCQGLLPIGTVYLTRAVVNSLVAAYRAGGGWESIEQVLVLAAAAAGLVVLGELLGIAIYWVKEAQAELVRDRIHALVHEKSITVDLAFFELPDFYDHLHQVTQGAAMRPLAVLETLGSLVQNGITLAAMAGVMIGFGWWLPLVLVAGTLPALWVVLRYAQLQHRWVLERTADERRAHYYDWLLTTSGPAAEVRLLDVGRHFQETFQVLRRWLYRDRLRLAKGQALAELGAGLVALGVNGVALAWMGWKTIRGLVTPGDLAMFYQAFQQGLRLANGLLANVGALYRNMLFLSNLFEFLELQPQVVDPRAPKKPPERLEQGIRFEGVIFRYPGSTRAALENFSLTIPAGRITAVVGSNGAGKSTLIKLLCRFYDPQEGRVEMDGVDLRELAVADVRRRVTVLFQEPVHYQATVAENIALGDKDAGSVQTAIEEAARAAGAEDAIGRLPEGYQNQLGRWFESGMELSVGEWQRLALARAFYRQAPILVLDEPTSAMDPWAETDWLNRFRRLAAGRTSILITHRLTTALTADVIHVMEDGRIVESGTHAELVALGGRYARAWKAQTGVSDLGS